jgi:hypothetical protein
MSKRLIKTERGRGLYEISDEFGAGRLVWEQLPKLDAADPAARLAAESATKIPDLPGGLYGNDEQRRANERRRAADAVLEQAGLRPPRGWLRAARRGRPGRIGLSRLHHRDPERRTANPVSMRALPTRFCVSPRKEADLS